MHTNNNAHASYIRYLTQSFIIWLLWKENVHADNV